MITCVYQAPSCHQLLMSIPCPTWAQDPPTVDPRKTFLLYFILYLYQICSSFWIISRKRRSLVSSYQMCKRSANNQWTATAHIHHTWYSTYMVMFLCQASSCQPTACLYRHHAPTWAHDPPSVDPRKTLTFVILCLWRFIGYQLDYRPSQRWLGR